MVQSAIPSRVTIPLRQGFGDEVPPVVQLGQKVAGGEIIARDDGTLSSPVHSSISGEVVDIRNIDHLGGEVAAVVIESDGSDDCRRLEGHASKWEDLSAEQIGELIYLSGAGSLGSAGVPTGFGSSAIAPADVRHVIVRTVGSEVHNISPDVLLRDEGLAHFVDGLNILRAVMREAEFHLALGASQKHLIKSLSQSLPNDGPIDLFTVPCKYPVQYDEVLTRLLLGKRSPHGSSAASMGVVVLDVQAVLHVYEAVAEGKPLIETTLAMCGPGFAERPHVRARVGSSLEHVIDGRVSADKDVRLVRNSALTGETFSDVSSPIDRTVTTIIGLVEETEREFLSFLRPGLRKDSYSGTCLSILSQNGGAGFQKICGTNLHGERRPCIFCGFCEEVCPVAIIPHLLYHYVQKDLVDETLLKYGIFHCIECNLCSYVCPSKIPVARAIKGGKAELTAQGYGRAEAVAACEEAGQKTRDD